jgi:divalent metal cation (Fe/Co/Zn/Cd) transporter
MYHWTRRVGRKTSSMALMANAWHHRSDALSSLPCRLGCIRSPFTGARVGFPGSHRRLGSLHILVPCSL